MKKRAYEAPVIQSEAIQIGVFGAYGSGSGQFIRLPRRRRRRPNWPLG